MSFLLSDTRRSISGFTARLYGDPLFRNSFFLLMASGFSAVLGLIFWLVVARYYSATELGLASALISAVSLIALFSSLGFHNGLIRFLPQEKDKGGMINSALTVVGLISIPIAAIFIWGLPLWSSPLLFLRQSFPLLISFILFSAVWPFLYMHRSAFVSFNSSGHFFIEQMIYMGLKVPLVIALVAFGVAGIFYSWGIALFLALIIAAFLLRKSQPDYVPLPAIKRKAIGRMMHFSLGNYLAEAIGSAPPFVLPLLIIGTLGAEMNAYYYIAYNISAALLMIPVAIEISLFSEGAHQPEKLRLNVIKAIKFSLLILIPAIALFFLLGDKFLLLFGGEYSKNALELLWLLLLSTIPTAANFLYIAVKQAQTRVKPIILVRGSAAVLTIAACYVLMGIYGLTGIGLGFILGQGIVTIIIGLKLMGEGVISKGFGQ